MKPIVWILLLAGVSLNATAQLLLKGATHYSGVLVSDAGAVAWQNANRLLHAAPFWGGIGCYVISVGLWLGALSRAPVSVAYPMLSLGYIMNAVAAAALFGESLSSQKVAGVLLILFGVVVLSRAA